MTTFNKIVIRHNTECGCRTALVFNEGRVWTHLVYIEYPMRVSKVLNKEAINFVDIQNTYPKSTVKKAIRTIKRMALIYYGNKKNIPKCLKRVYN